MLGVHGQHQSGGKDLIQIHRTVIQKQDLVVFLVLQSLGQQAVHRNAPIPAEGLEATVAHQLQRSLRRPLQNEGIRLISHCTRHLYRAGKRMLSIEVQAGQIQRKREGERSPGNMKNRTEIQSHGTPHTMAQQTL